MAYRRTLRGASSDAAGSSKSFVACSSAEGLSDIQVSCPVIQIHGALRIPRSIVFTRLGYRRLLYEAHSYLTFLKSALSSYTVLYLGFSFSDAYLNELRSEIRSLLGNDGPPIAYAVTNDKSELERKFYLQHEGVHMINFDTQSEGWDGFDNILEEILSAKEA